MRHLYCAPYYRIRRPRAHHRVNPYLIIIKWTPEANYCCILDTYIVWRTFDRLKCTHARSLHKMYLSMDKRKR